MDRVIAFELLGLITSISAKRASKPNLSVRQLEIFLVIYYEICHVKSSLLNSAGIRGRRDELG